jgi:hypothetical protein
MENATKRIRKARREGAQATKKDLAPPTREQPRTPGMAGRDNPAEPRANARRKSLVTARKAKRVKSRGPRVGAARSI